MDVVETELCDYLQVRHVKLESSPSGSTDSLSPSRAAGQPKNQRASQLPAKFYKVGIRSQIRAADMDRGGLMACWFNIELLVKTNIIGGILDLYLH